jgi:quinol monooxygenase YgiN
MENSHYVIVILEAKSGKENALKEELLKVMELSRKEDACLDYKVHEDLSNLARFVLYETWTNKEDHAKQFQKSYITDFGKKLEGLLNSPYQAFAAKLLG